MGLETLLYHNHFNYLYEAILLKETLSALERKDNHCENRFAY